MIIVCCLVALVWTTTPRGRVWESNSAETAHWKSTADLGHLEMSELQNLSVFYENYSSYGGMGDFFFLFSETLKDVHDLFYFTTGTDGDHKRWMKQWAMNSDVRSGCLYVYITCFALSTHAGGLQEVNTPYWSTVTLMHPSPFVKHLEEEEFCRLWLSEFEALADPTKWLGITYRMTRRILLMDIHGNRHDIEGYELRWDRFDMTWNEGGWWSEVWWYDVIWFGTWDDMVWNEFTEMKGNDMIWFDILWYEMIPHDIV